MGTAFRYEMRCYTNPETLVSDRQFLNKAIPVHESLLPSPKVRTVKLRQDFYILIHNPITGEEELFWSETGLKNFLLAKNI